MKAEAQTFIMTQMKNLWLCHILLHKIQCIGSVAGEYSLNQLKETTHRKQAFIDVGYSSVIVLSEEELNKMI